MFDVLSTAPTNEKSSQTKGLEPCGDNVQQHSEPNNLFTGRCLRKSNQSKLEIEYDPSHQET